MLKHFDSHSEPTYKHPIIIVVTRLDRRYQFGWEARLHWKHYQVAVNEKNPYLALRVLAESSMQYFDEIGERESFLKGEFDDPVSYPVSSEG